MKWFVGIVALAIAVTGCSISTAYPPLTTTTEQDAAAQQVRCHRARRGSFPWAEQRFALPSRCRLHIRHGTFLHLDARTTQSTVPGH
jgi:hypothetical protein